MSKFKSYKKQGYVIGATNPEIHKMLGGKTLGQVGLEFKLADDAVGIVTTENPKNGEEIKQLRLTLNGMKVLVPFSRSIDEDFLAEEECLDGEFRITHKAVRDEHGNAVTDADGKPVLDETAPYMSFGKPSGLSVKEDVAAWTGAEAGNVA